MDKLAEKIGLYDFWIIFFPGALGYLQASFSILLFYQLQLKCYKFVDVVFHFQNVLPQALAEWVVFILISFFLGIILQEIGYIMHKLFEYHDATEGLFCAEQGIFSQKEVNDFKGLYAICGWQEGSNGTVTSKEVFHKINIILQEQGKAAKYAKLNIVQNISLSLAALLLLQSLVFIIMIFLLGLKGNLTLLGLSISCGILCRVFYNRTSRFNRYWVRNIVYAGSIFIGK